MRHEIDADVAANIVAESINAGIRQTAVEAVERWGIGQLLDLDVDTAIDRIAAVLHDVVAGDVEVPPGSPVEWDTVAAYDRSMLMSALRALYYRRQLSDTTTAVRLDFLADAQHDIDREIAERRQEWARDAERFFYKKLGIEVRVIDGQLAILLPKPRVEVAE